MPTWVYVYEELKVSLEMTSGSTENQCSLQSFLNKVRAVKSQKDVPQLANFAIIKNED